MNNFKTYLGYAATLLMGAASLTACTDDEQTTGQTKQGIEIAIAPSLATTTLETALATNSRATANAAYTPAAGSHIYLFYGAMSNAPTGESALYTYAEASGETPAGWIPAVPIYWDDIDAKASGTDATALYPFFAAAPQVPAIAPATAEVAADQTTGYIASDQLVAYNTTGKRNQTLALDFQHILSQITLEVTTAEDGKTNRVDLSKITSATLTGAVRSYTVDYTGSTPEVPATATAAAVPASDIRLVPNGATTQGNPLYLAVLPQQSIVGAALSLTLVIDGNTYRWTSTDATAFEAGKSHKLTLRVLKNAVNGSFTVAPWTEGTKLGETDVIADGTVTADETLTGIKEPGTLYLYTNINLSFTQPSELVFAQGIYPVAYDKNATPAATFDKNDAAYSPLVWDNMPKFKPGTDDQPVQYAYAAFYVPQDLTDPAVKNQEKDYLSGTSEPTNWGTSPDFSTVEANRMKHFMAQLTITLTNTDGAYTTAQLKAATLTLKRTLKFSLSLPATGAKTLPVMKAVDVTAPDEAHVSLLNTSGNGAADPVTFSALMCGIDKTGNTPGQSYAPDDEMFTLVIDGKTYTLAAPQAIQLASGQNTTLTLNVSKTTLLPGTVSVSDWIEMKGPNGEFEY